MSFISIKSGSISLLLFIVITLQGFGQVERSDRFELVLDDLFGFENPRVANIGKEGVLIYRRIREKTNDRLELIKVDTSLLENWRGSIPIDKNLAISKVEAHDQFVFILLNSVAYGGFDLNVVAVNVLTREFYSYVVKNLIPLKTTEFRVSDKTLLIGGYFNDIPVVLHYSLATGRSRLLPGFFNDPGELNQLKTYDNGLIDIIVSTKNIQRKKVLWVRSYTSDGDLINSTILQDPDKNLLFGKSLRKPDGTQIVTGSFSLRNTEYSKGIFYSEISPEGDYSIRYYNFTDFENFFSYLRPAREARIKERIERRNQKGRKIRNSYFFLTNELRQVGDDYMLLGEVYYPRYYYLNTFGYSMRGDRIFDGYRYTHAIVLGFNKNGDLRWDNSFEMNDVKTFNLVQYVKAAPKVEHLDLLYLYENKLHIKTINRNKVLEAKSLKDLDLKYDTDVVREKNTEYSLLEYWFDSYFLAFGIQNVNNLNAGRDNSGRRVLFINKLKFK